VTQLPISLPSGFTPLVKANDKVASGTVLAQKTAVAEHVLSLTDVFSISPNEARKTLLKAPGENVAKGETIAVRKRLFGKKHVITSNISGVVLRFERDTGNLVIQANSEQVNSTVISPVDGIVTLCDNEKIVVSSPTKGVSGIKGTGGRFFRFRSLLCRRLQTWKAEICFTLWDQKQSAKFYWAADLHGKCCLKVSVWES
jgi:hypothetical protein